MINYGEQINPPIDWTHIQSGEDCLIWQYSTVCAGTVLGDKVVIGSNVWIGKNCEIGSYTRIQHGAFIPNNTIIGKSVFIGPNVTLTDDKYPKAGMLYQPHPPIIEDDVSIGAGAVILPGVRIGRGAMIGAGSVVTQDVTAFETSVGVPARTLTHN